MRTACAATSRCSPPRWPLACLPLSGWRPAFFAGILLTLVACLLLTPFLSLELARLLRRPMKWLRPVEGALAADSLIQAPRRTSATVAALMLSLALVVGQGGVARAQPAIHRRMDEQHAESRHVRLHHGEHRLPRLRASRPACNRSWKVFPASRRSSRSALPRLQFHGYPVLLLSTELAKLGRRVKRHMISGDEADHEPPGLAGKGSDPLGESGRAGQASPRATRWNWPRPPECCASRWSASSATLSNQMGTIILERSLYVRYFQDDTVDIFRVYLKPGASQEEVRGRIIERVGRQRHLFVMLNREIRDYVGKVMNQWFGITYVQVVVAMLVAILGIVNTLTVSISDRRRELGVLRAVGGLRSQIRGTVWMEAGAIGIIGLALGMATGAITLYYELQAIQHDISGMPFAYEFPWGIVAMLVPVILFAAFGAAILPAETAVRGSLVEALEYE